MMSTPEMNVNAGHLPSRQDWIHAMKRRAFCAARGLLGVATALRAFAAKLTITPPALSPAKNPSRYAWVFKLTNAL